MRAGSATHSYDADQRCVAMIARELSTGSYVGVVPQPLVAVPGYYVLLAVTERNVPSKGVFVQILLPG
jgi:Domain of unknown function (DUF1929)